MVLYTTLMTTCHKGGQPERAMRIFRTMEGLPGLAADVVSFILVRITYRSPGKEFCFLPVACTLSRQRSSDEEACMWPRDGLSRSALVQVAYNQAMASCSWEQAWACFHAMRRAGVQPNTRSYNAVSALS